MKKITLIATLLLSVMSMNISAQPTPGFHHPGMMHSQADFDRVKQRLQAGEYAATQSLANLRVAGPVNGDHGGNWAVNVDIARGIAGAENYMNAYRNAARAYQLALLWKITGEQGYGDRAIDVLNAYATWNKSLSGNTNISLIPAFIGYQFLNAAEIMRDYSAWRQEDIEKFKQYMIDVWFGVAEDFLYRRHDTVTRETNWFHYYSNWGVGNELFCISLGIFCDLPDVYNYGMYWLTEGPGNESIFVGKHRDEAADEMCGQGWGLLPWFHKDKRGPMGYFAQMQESGRDQGHALASLGLLGNALQTCYVQGDNLFNNMYNPLVPGIEGSTMAAAAAEYVAAYNNGIDNLPYTLNWWMGGFGPNSRGQWRPIWQLFINAYENRMGIAMPNSKTMHNAMGLEWGGGNYGNNSGGYDHTGWGDLMFNDEPVTREMAPTPLYPTITGPTLLARRGVDPTIVEHHTGWVSGVTPGTEITMSVALPDGEEDSGNWKWEDGPTGKTRTITANHSGIYRVHYINKKGVASTQLFSIAVRGEGVKATLDGTITYRGKANNTTTQSMGKGTTAVLSTFYHNGGYIESEKWYDENGNQVGTGGSYTYRQQDDKSHTITFVLTNHSGVEIRKEFTLLYDPTDLSHLLPDAGCQRKDYWELSTNAISLGIGTAGTTGSYIKYEVEATQKEMGGWGLPIFSATQKATNIEPGKYTITAQGIAAMASEVEAGQSKWVDGIFYTANGISTPMATQANASKAYTLTCYVGEDGILQVGFCNLTNQNRAYSDCGASIAALDEMELRKVQDADISSELTALQKRATTILKKELPSAIADKLRNFSMTGTATWQTVQEYSALVSDAEMAARVFATYKKQAEHIGQSMPENETLQQAVQQVMNATTTAELYAGHDALRTTWIDAMQNGRIGNIDVTMLMHNTELADVTDGFIDNTTRWSSDVVDGNFRILPINGSDLQRGEAKGTNMIERWHGNNFAGGQQIIYQTTAGMPLGRYTFNAATMRGHEAGKLELFVLGNSATYSTPKSITSTAVLKQYSASARLTSTTAQGKLTYGVRALADNGTNWVTLADMQLIYDSPRALLIEALAEAATLTYGVDKDGKLATAVANAQAALDDESTKPSTLMTRYNALLTQIENYKKNNSDPDHPYGVDEEMWNAFHQTIDDMRQLAEHSNETAEGAKQTFIDAVEKAYNTVVASPSESSINTQLKNVEKARQTYVMNAIPHWGYEFDMTFKVVNADISSATGGWLTDGTGNFQRMTNSEVDGEYKGAFWEKWDIESYYFKSNDRPVYQAISAMSKGTYRLRMAAFRKNQFNTLTVNKGSMNVFLNDKKTEVTSEVMNYYEVQAENTNGTITLGLKAGTNNNANWEALADVHLYYLGSEDVTGIDAIDMQDHETSNHRNIDTSAVFDLGGRAVNKQNLKPGLYIMGGKKIIIK